MKQMLQTPQMVQDKIEGEMVIFKDGINQIALGNYALSFKKDYVFLGFTKNKNQVILGDIYVYGATNQDGTRNIKYSKKYGKIEYKVKTKPNYVKEFGKFKNLGDIQYGEWIITTDGGRYSEKIMEVEL